MRFKTCYFVLLLALPAFTQAQSDCHNVLTGGLICCDQTVCPGKMPQAILESQSPEGGDGLMEYEWHRLRVIPNVAPLWEVIPGAVSAAYQPDTLSVTSYFLRETRRQGCTEWMVSNVVIVTVAAPNDPACAGSVSTQETVSGLASVSCSPSPFMEILAVQNGTYQQVSVQIFDAFGKRVAEATLPAGAETMLDTPTWPAGLYVVHLKGADGETRTRSVVKTTH